MRTRSRLGIALIAAVPVLVIGVGCVVHRPLVLRSIADAHVEKPVKQLAAAYPDQFTKPFSLLVFTDESATCGMREARWWRNWEAFLTERGWGFLLVTSREDSLDLVIAGELDSVRAPTLVVPSCKHYLRELGIPFVPLNVLVDSTARVLHVWSAPADTVGSRQLLEEVAAIAAERR